METSKEKIENFTTLMAHVSKELKAYYPNLTDFEVLTISLSIIKNSTLDNIYSKFCEMINSIDCIGIGLDSINSNMDHINYNLAEIEICLNHISNYKNN